MTYTRVQMCLSLTSAFGVGLVRLSGSTQKRTEISKKSRWLPEWLIICADYNSFVCIVFTWLKSLFPTQWFFFYVTPDPFKFKSIKTLITHFTSHIKLHSYSMQIYCMQHFVLNLVKILKVFNFRYSHEFVCKGDFQLIYFFVNNNFSTKFRVIKLRFHLVKYNSGSSWWWSTIRIRLHRYIPF